MEKDSKGIFTVAEAHNVVFDYRPKEISALTGASAEDFVRDTTANHSDFKINDLIAERAGIAKINRKQIEDRVEEEALKRLKIVEEKAYKEAYELGLIEGAEKAFQEKSEQLNQRLAQLDEILKHFEDIKCQMLRANEVELLNIINLLATKLAIKEVKANPEIIMSLMSQLIEESQAGENVIIKLSKEDLQFIESVREKLGRKADFLKRVRLEASEDIQTGGCILESNYGVIDATLSQRVEKVWAAMEKKLPREHQGQEINKSQTPAAEESETDSDSNDSDPQE